MSQEIVLNLFSSFSNLRDPQRFYGWVWALADNVYKTYLRQGKRQLRMPVAAYTSDDDAQHPEAMALDNEEKGILYRELSLLSRHYRECMVLYYLKGKSGDEIASSLNISVDMVKQYLFKSRKKVQQGMDTIRERGERSVDPRSFMVNFWGNSEGKVASQLFERKLPGNIMLEAYYAPVSVEQLSIELGVAAVYLEDEIDILVRRGVLRATHNQKYQSNIIIFTHEFETELYQKTHGHYRDVARYLYDYVREHEASLRRAGLGSDVSVNTLLWQLSTLALLHAGTERFLDRRIRHFPSLGNGSEGYLWGLERKYGDNLFDFCVQPYADKQGNRISLVDFAILGKQHDAICQRPMADLIIRIAAGNTDSLDEDEEELLSTLIQDGYVHRQGEQLSLCFPVLTTEQFQAILEVLEPALEKVSSVLNSTLPIMVSTLANHVPTNLRSQVEVIAALKQVESLVVYTMHQLYLEKLIELPRPATELLTCFVELKSPPPRDN